MDALLADTINHLLKLTGGADQKIINCYRQTDKCKGQSPMAELIESLAVKGIAPGCPELATLDRTLKKRMSGILAFFDHEHPANGPTEAINGRLETLSGIALRFHNLSNYITRSLLHTGGFKQTIQIHL
ncbi:transposase [Bifidobacterium sp.]|uniref:transposase n=1 Tax=Bifidobacterium sp. TaxID=41200 RepID=UPI0025BA7F3F|nr:transposase [Bifidobacterium sp.]MCH4209453.1 transposase [Bifidobacterium sp.]MCI1225116.1 transposase [Bifidobacterium sp.]